MVAITAMISSLRSEMGTGMETARGAMGMETGTVAGTAMETETVLEMEMEMETEVETETETETETGRRGSTWALGMGMEMETAKRRLDAKASISCL